MTAVPSLEQLKAEGAAVAAARETTENILSNVSDMPGYTAGAGVHPPASSWWTNQNAMTMSVAILVFGAAIIAIAAFTIRPRGIDGALRLFGTIMVLTLTAFLVVAGYTDSQIIAPLGLFGTIAGYLLGKESRPSDRRPDREPG